MIRADLLILPTYTKQKKKRLAELLKTSRSANFEKILLFSFIGDTMGKGQENNPNPLRMIDTSFVRKVSNVPFLGNISLSCSTPPLPFFFLSRRCHAGDNLPWRKGGGRGTTTPSPINMGKKQPCSAKDYLFAKRSNYTFVGYFPRLNFIFVFIFLFFFSPFSYDACQSK